MAENSEELNPIESEQTTEETLGAGGKAALAEEREARKQAERKLKALEAQLEGLDPEKLKGIKDSLDREDRLRADLDQRVKAAAEAAKAEALQQVKVKDQKLSEVLAEKSQLFKNQALANAFQIAGGRTGGSQDGETYFDALMGAVGGRFRVDEAGALVVIDKKGEPLLSEEGDPVAPAQYLESLKSHPVYGHFFAPISAGHGGGMKGSGNVIAGNMKEMSALEKLSFGLGQ